VLLLFPQFHQYARTFRAFKDVQVVESGKRHLAGSFDQTLKNGRIGTSLALWVRVVSENVLLQLFKQQRLVVVVQREGLFLSHGILSN